MKRFSMILLSVFLLWACGKIQEGTDGTGGGGSISSECIIPADAQAGTVVIIQWDGFASGADLFLVLSDGKEYDMEVRGVTPSGLMFRIPSNVPAGVYMIQLVQNGTKTELGHITVTAAPIPATGLRIPSSAKQGEVMHIIGVGFEDGCSVRFAGSEAEPVTLDALLTNTGISVVIPEDMPEGGYEVSLVQDGMSWVIAENFQVFENQVVKTLVRIEYDAPYIGSAILRYSWEVSHDDPVTLTLSEYVVQGEEVSLEAYDRYECDESMSEIVLVQDGRESSNDMEIIYYRDEESGLPNSSDVLIYGNSELTRFTWTYDSGGFLTEISSPKLSFRSLGYTDGNLTQFALTGFRYDDPELVNHPGAADVVWGYMSLMETDDPFVYFPYLLGWYDPDSSLLPTAIVVPDPADREGKRKIEYPISYEFDKAGYVISMSWSTSKVGYFYK